jgi:hypothetical protein
MSKLDSKVEEALDSIAENTRGLTTYVGYMDIVGDLNTIKQHIINQQILISDLDTGKGREINLTKKLQSKLDKIEGVVDRKIYYNTLNCELFIDKIKQILGEPK